MKVKKWIGKHRKLIVIGLILLIIVVFFVWRTPGAASNLVEETPEMRDIYTYKSFVGNVEPAEDTSVISKVSQQVTQLLVAEGDTVKKGDVIAVLDSSSVEQNIEKTQTSLSVGKTSNSYNISDAQRSYDNYKESIDSGRNSSLNSAQNTLDSAYETLTKAQEEYNSISANIDNGTDTGTKTQYNARKSAQDAVNAAENKLKNLQSAYDSAKKAYEDAAAAGDSGQSDPSGTDAASAVAGTEPAGNLESLKQEYANAEMSLNTGKSELENAKKTLESANADFDLAKQEAIKSKKEALDNAQTSYDTAQKNYDTVKLSVDQQLETYKAAIDKTKASSSTASTELELQQLKDSLEDYTIYAPCDGTITELDVSEGSMVTGGVSIATISDLSSMKVAINVDEYSVLDTGEGSSVTILVDSIGKSYDGVIRQVSDTASLNNGVSYFEAVVDFNADDNVKSGMSVEVRLTNVDKKDVLTVSADAVHYNDDNTAYVIVKNGESQEIRDVELGVTDGNYVEILSGLDIEDTVLVTPSMDASFMEQRQQAGGQ